MEVTIKRFVTWMLTATIFMASLATYGGDNTGQVRVNRYTLSDIEPASTQLDLMSVIVDVEYPKEVKTVGQAIQTLLAWHGFKLGRISAGSYSQYVLFLLPLPEIHRQLGPLRLETALRVLGGQGFDLEVNPVTREVRYQIIDAYDDMLQTNEVIQAKRQWESIYGLTHESTHESTDESKVCDQDTLESQNMYGPVKAGEYLSKIALSIKPGNTSVEQVMMAIYDQNPASFSQDNINLLRRGAVLELPNKSAFLHESHESAKTRVREHYQKWLRLKESSATPQFLSE